MSRSTGWRHGADPEEIIWRDYIYSSSALGGKRKFFCMMVVIHKMSPIILEFILWDDEYPHHPIWPEFVVTFS